MRISAVKSLLPFALLALAACGGEAASGDRVESGGKREVALKDVP